MDELVKKLSNGEHEVIFEPRTRELGEVKERLTEGFVFVKFLETQGETELGISIDHKMTHLNEVEFEPGKGTLHLVGTCDLNFTKVRCNAEIDLTSRQGKASLEVLG